MRKTEHYQLNQWEPTDRLSREDFNADNAAIDAALAGNAKALSDYQTANDAAVAKKAETSAVTALQQSVNSQIAALSTALGSGGQTCRIAWGTYAGTGKSGSANATKLTPGFCPVAAMVGNPGDAAVYGWPTTMMRNCTSANGVSVYGHTLTVTWNDNTVSWYGSSAEEQMNLSGTTYYYVVLGYGN